MNSGVRPLLANGIAEEKEAPEEEEDETDEEDDGMEEEEEALTSMAMTVPVKPSQREVDDHNRTHLPYRNWCEILRNAMKLPGKHRLA